MAFGILARVTAIILDGSPNLVMYQFAVVEAVGVIVILILRQIDPCRVKA